MNHKEKLKFFWKVTRFINKKYCKGKLKIKRIVLCKNLPITWKKRTSGFYNRDTKEIYVKDKKYILVQFRTFIHELVHAYEHQITKRDHSNVDKKRYHSKKWYRCLHNKNFNKTFNKFGKEVIRNLKMDLRVK
jgi:hypothetical protein